MVSWPVGDLGSTAGAKPEERWGKANMQNVEMQPKW